MVPPDSHRITRVLWYSGIRSEGIMLSLTGPSPCIARLSSRVQLTQCFVTPWWVYGPTRSLPQPLDDNAHTLTSPRFGLFPVRSPLLRESLLISLPQGTEMINFPWFASQILCVQIRDPAATPQWVAPFGNPRIKACSQLPGAYRSRPRPSSPLDAKASTVRPKSLDRPI